MITNEEHIIAIRNDPHKYTGSIWEIRGDLLMFCQTAPEVFRWVGIKDGNRWFDSFEVPNHAKFISRKLKLKKTTTITKVPVTTMVDKEITTLEIINDGI